MRRILVVGTDLRTMKALTGQPGLEDCTLERADGVDGAVARCRKTAYRAALIATRGSAGRALEIHEALRAARPGVKTVLLAGQSTPEEVIAALRAGVFVLFTRPFGIETVGDMLAQAVRERARRSTIEVVSGMPRWLSLRVDCRAATAERLVHWFAQLGRDLPEQHREGVMFAFREILINAMEHGTGFDPSEMVEIAAVRTARAQVYYVRDPGPGFKHGEVPHAAISNPPDDPVAHAAHREKEGLRPGGFGILLARRIVDELIYSERGNEVVLIKHLR